MYSVHVGIWATWGWGLAPAALWFRAALSLCALVLEAALHCMHDTTICVVFPHGYSLPADVNCGVL
jgi:hypothetical protein